MKTGNDRVLEFLRDRRWHTSGEIERECEVTAHSRLADLRTAGNVIEKRRNPGQTGRAKFSYRLARTALEVQLEDESLAELDDVDAGGAATAPSSASDERSWLHHGDTEANGDSSAAGERIPPAAEPAVVDDIHRGLSEPAIGECGEAGRPPPGLPAAQDDAAWRDLFPPESVDERVPPPESGRAAAPGRGVVVALRARERFVDARLLAARDAAEALLERARDVEACGRRGGLLDYGWRVHELAAGKAGVEQLLQTLAVEVREQRGLERNLEARDELACELAGSVVELNLGGEVGDRARVAQVGVRDELLEHEQVAVRPDRGEVLAVPRREARDADEVFGLQRVAERGVAFAAGGALRRHEEVGALDEQRVDGVGVDDRVDVDRPVVGRRDRGDVVDVNRQVLAGRDLPSLEQLLVGHLPVLRARARVFDQLPAVGMDQPGHLVAVDPRRCEPDRHHEVAEPERPVPNRAREIGHNQTVACWTDSKTRLARLRAGVGERSDSIDADEQVALAAWLLERAIVIRAARGAAA